MGCNCDTRFRCAFESAALSYAVLMWSSSELYSKFMEGHAFQMTVRILRPRLIVNIQFTTSYSAIMFHNVL